VRTSFRIIAAAAATSIGFLAFAATPAMASVSAPDCESGASTVVCNAFGGNGSTLTWTIVSHWEGTTNTITYKTTANYTKFNCSRGELFGVTYSFVSGGVTQTSGTGTVVCNTGDWP
jgi:hypothetical protein